MNLFSLLVSFQSIYFLKRILAGYMSTENVFYAIVEKSVCAFSEELHIQAKKYKKFGSIESEPRYNAKIKIKNAQYYYN